MSTSFLLYGLPAHNPDLLYALGATVSDPLIYITTPRGRFVIARDTETDVLKRKVTGAAILTHSDYFRKAKSKTSKPTDADLCLVLLREKGIRRVAVHRDTPVFMTDHLRKHGIRVDIGDFPVFPKRLIKTAAEIKAITAAQTATFQAMGHVEKILRASRIQGKNLHYKGKTLTSEYLHAAAKMVLIEKGYDCPQDIIIACGNASTEPHNRGSGPIRPHQSIIVDIFPRSIATGFFGDATRTFCKGTPSAALQRMYFAVQEAQEMAIRMIRPGVDGQTIHNAIHTFFRRAGFTTGMSKGRSVGFTHGTGHGLGLALHEEPTRISASSCILKAGNVVTVEPGLYYPGIGAIRIEDVVVVTKTGGKVLGNYPKKLKV
jgi:Xaa-Pro aminopeptidase